MDRKLRQRRLGASVATVVPRSMSAETKANTSSVSVLPIPSSSAYTWNEILLLLAVAYAVAGVAFGLYVPAKHGVYVYDDKVALVRNPDVGVLHSEVSDTVTMPPLGDIFSHDYWGTPLFGEGHWTHKSYRPLTILSFRVDICRHAYGFVPCLFGQWGERSDQALDSFINGLTVTFHVTNHLLHGLCSALVVVTFYATIFRRFWHTRENQQSALLAAGVTGLLYAVHPSRVEAVASLVGRADTLACIMALASVLTYTMGIYHLSGVKQISTIALSMVCVMIATLFKETGAASVAIMIGIDVYTHLWPADWRELFNKSRFSKRERRCVARVTGVAFASIILLHYRIEMTGGGLGIDMDIYFNKLLEYGFWYRMANVPVIFVANLDRMLVPTWLAYDYSEMTLFAPQTTFWDVGRMVLNCLSPFTLLSGILFVALQRPESRTALTLLSGWLVVSLLPSCHLFFPVGFLLAERVLCLGSAAMCGIVAVCFVCVWREKRHRALAMILLATFVAISVGHTSDRILAWKNEKALFTEQLLVFEQHEPSLHGMGWLSYQQKDFDKAAEFFLNPSLHLHAESAWMLGRCYYQKGQMEQARVHLQRAVELNPIHKANNELGVIYWSLGDQQKAFEHVTFALNAPLPHAAPERRAILNNAACMYLLFGNQPQRAYELLEEAYSLLPDLVHLSNMVYALAKLGKYQEAIDALQVLQSRGGGMDLRSRDMATKILQLLAKPNLPNTIPPFCTLHVVE